MPLPPCTNRRLSGSKHSATVPITVLYNAHILTNYGLFVKSYPRKASLQRFAKWFP